MNKQEFLEKLKDGLSGLPREDIDERLAFYGEMIDDKVEDGLTEEEAINDIGSVEDAVNEIISDIPLAALVKKRVRPKRKLRAWETALIILGSPVWAPLLISALAVFFSLYVSLWAIIVSFWSVAGSCALCSVASLVPAAVLIGQQNALAALAVIGAALIIAGLSIFMFFGSKAATKGVLRLTEKSVTGIKRTLFRRENANEKVD